MTDKNQPPPFPRAGAAAYYLWPLAWLGDPPDNVLVNVEPGGWPPEPDLDALADVVAEHALPQGVRVRAHRDGFVVFDFASWAPLIVPTPDDPQHFEKLASTVLRRVALMNAHLACLHTALIVGESIAWGATALSPGSIFSIPSFEPPDQGMSLPDARLTHLLHARWSGSYASGPKIADYRLGHRFPISVEVVQDSFRRLGELLARLDSDRVVSLLDLLLRSGAAFGEHDHSQCLIDAWAVIESLLQELWNGYVEGNRTREIDGTVVPFITAARKKRLTDGRDITASLTAELASLLDLLPFDVYADVSTDRVARNNWIHDLRPVPGATAALAMSVAERMLKLVCGVEIALPKGLSLQL